MSHPIHQKRGRRRAGIALAVGCAFAVAPAAAQAASVGLGTANSFSVLAGSTVTNTGPSVLTGSIGLHAGTAVVGFPPGIVTDGTIHAADGVALQAKNDLTTAYNDAAGRSTTENVASDLVGRTLAPGVYTSPTLSLSGELVLDAQGDPNAVFVFQAGSTLITSSASRVRLQGAAQACNVFWQVGSSATLGTASSFTGNILALTSVTLTTSATLAGRALARNGAVTLDSNVITRSVCAAGTTPNTGSPTTTPGGTSGGAPEGAPGGGPAIAPPGSRTGLPTRNGSATLRPTPRTPGSPSSPRRPGSPGEPCTAGFSATVRGRQIKRVVFSLDGKRVSSRSRSPFRVTVRAGAGRHTIGARVTFKDATRAKSLSLRYRACGAAVLSPRRGPSRFTG